MGTISSGVGLISGINIDDVVSKLMEIESRPRDQIKQRKDDLTEQQTAMMKIQALAMAVQISAAGFNKESVFQQKTVTSSNEDILTAEAGKFSPEGSWQFVVKQLASNHSFVSRGYSDRDSNIGTGTLSFEIGQGQLARPTSLNFINGQKGFQRGKILITDSAGNSSEVDLTLSLTMQDVIDQINRTDGINVRASVSGDSLVLTDTSGGSGQLTVSDIADGTTALDLGIRNDVAQQVATDKIKGSDLIYLTNDTLLKDLNDGNGVRGLDSFGDDIIFRPTYGNEFKVDFRSTLYETFGDETQSTKLRALNHGAGVRQGKFRITDQNGNFVDINLAEDLGPDPTLAQLKSYIQDEAKKKGMDISVIFHSMDHLKITDNSKPAIQTTDNTSSERRSHFIIEDLDGGHTAADLGILGDVSGKNINGEKIWFMDTVGDVINAVNNHWNNDGSVQLAIDPQGNGIKVIDNSGPGGHVEIIVPEDNTDSKVAEDLGLLNLDSNGTGRRLIAGLNTVMLRSLNGGTGGDTDSDNYGSNRISTGGIVRITDRDGHSSDVDLTNAFSVQDILDGINNAGTNITARINQNGNGIILEDNTSQGSGNLIVTDVGDGTLAEKLHIAVNADTNLIDSGNLQLQYVSRATQLKDLRQGRGISRGSFTITDGRSHTVKIDLANDDVHTLGDVIDLINGRTAIRARINDTGDGLLLYDTSEGEGLIPMKITEGDGTTAHDLGLLAPAQKNAEGKYYIDGSYEFKLDVGGGDGLEDIVNNINDADIGIKASIIHDGVNYRMSFISEISGRQGRVYLDAGQTNLSTQTLSQGRDAILFLGDGSSEHPLLLSSSSNSVENAIHGTTLNLHAASDEPVQLTVERNHESIAKQINGFVEKYNDLMKELADVSKFDPNTMQRGVLFADSTIRSIQSALQSMIIRIVPGLTNYNDLAQIGITFGSHGNQLVKDENGNPVSLAVAGTPQLVFDEAKFNQAMKDDPDAIAELFTKKDVGIGDYIADSLDKLAGRDNSAIKNSLNTMDSRKKLFDKRIDSLNKLLKAKEDSLYKQFYAMEKALASLQSQQNALASLTGSVPTTGK